MNVFISYAREDKSLAETLSAALNAAGHEPFLDTKNLLPGQEFNAHIKAAVEKADLFIFLASQNSVTPGSYALTELAFAEAKWRNPSGYVLPVFTHDFEPSNLPAYLRPINGLQIHGNLEAEVVGWVQERESGSGGSELETPEDRLKRWFRFSQPPIGKIRKLPPSSIGMCVGSMIFIAMGIFAANSFHEWNARNPVGSFLHVGSLSELIFFFPLAVGAIVFFGGIFKAIQGLRGARAVAAIVLNRDSTANGRIIVHLQTVKGDHLRLEPVTRSARETYPGELGWAYVRGSLLLDFKPAR